MQETAIYGIDFYGAAQPIVKDFNVEGVLVGSPPGSEGRAIAAMPLYPSRLDINFMGAVLILVTEAIAIHAKDRLRVYVVAHGGRKDSDRSPSLSLIYGAFYSEAH
jgi:hypothetical protein